MKNITVGILLSLCSIAAVQADSAFPKCGDTRNQDVVQHISRGQKIEEVIAYLDGAGIPFFITSQTGKVVDPQVVRDKGYAALGPLELLIRSDYSGGVISPAAVSETLIMDFDKDAVLISEDCRTYSTGK